MGRYVVPELVRMGHAVDAVSLDAPDPSLDPPGVRRIQGNAKDEAFLAPLLARHYDAIVDFLIYPTAELAPKLPRMAAACGHYVYLSSYRVYDGKDVPVREDSRLLVDTADDPILRNSDDYSIYKARGERILRSLGRRNWTIVRPSITYSTYRYQLVTLEAPTVVGRADRGKAVVLPETARNVQGTLTWAGDNARFIARLVFNGRAAGETYTVATAEHHPWGEIAELYASLRGLKAVWAPEEDFLRIVDPNPWNPGAAWQLRTDRLFERVIDNSKVLAATGLTQADLMPTAKGLETELAKVPRGFDWHAPWLNTTGIRMDAWLENAATSPLK
jgi:nucleoside-diphosphate-sugar epimerase